MKRSLRCLRPGVVSYAEGLSLQKQARAMVEARHCDGVLLLLEHRPVITIGRSGGKENLVAAIADLQTAGIDIVESDRGGNITCHNPGQLVGYPIFNLSRWQEDVHWYVEQIEEVLIQTLAELGVRAGRKARYTGVWVGNRKIAAIGVSARRWITGHGFALNVQNDLKLFKAIIPCGIEEFGVTSLQDQGISMEVPKVAERIACNFGQVFAASFEIGAGSDTLNEQ